MTPAEAWQFFKVNDRDEMEEIYEEQLFEFKQFFLSKVPVQKLFNGRLSKLKKLQDAYEALEGEIQPQPVHEITFDILSNNIHEVFLGFQKSRNDLKQKIANETSALNLEKYIRRMLALEKEYATFWKMDSDDEGDIIISKEPDPMYLLENIKSYQQKDGFTFIQLKNLENNPPEILVQEMKRLSLLFKRF